MSWRRRASELDGRPRVVAWIAGVTALGLTLMILSISVVLRVTAENDIREGLEQEAGEIRQFSANGLDPETGRPFDTAQRFVEVYLARQAAGPAELMVGGAADAEPVAEQRGAPVHAWSALDPAVRERILAPGSGGRTTDGANGRISWKNVRVEGRQGSGYIAVLAFHEPGEARTRTQLGVLGLLALGSLAATGLVAWVVSGRIVLHTGQFTEAVAAAKSVPGAPRLPQEGGPEYVRLATAANGLVEAAEEAVEQERRFCSDLVYELRTPLAVLQGSLEQPGDTLEQRDITRFRLLAEVRRLRRLVGDLVVLNNLERPGDLRPQQQVDVGDFTTEAVAAWRDRAEDPGAPRVTIERGPVASGVKSLLDEPRLARALDELIENAIAASEEGQAVTVSSRSEAGDGGDRIVIEVADTGRGVPEEERSAVLRRFARASNDPQPGAGLGMTVADRLVSALGGSLTLRDNPGGGTIARIDLPRPVHDDP